MKSSFSRPVWTTSTAATAPCRSDFEQRTRRCTRFLLTSRHHVLLPPSLPPPAGSDGVLLGRLSGSGSQRPHDHAVRQRGGGCGERGLVTARAWCLFYLKQLSV